MIKKNFYTVWVANRNNRLSIILAAALFSVLCASCGIRLKGAKRGVGGAVETFLVEGGATQFFIKPLKFKGEGQIMLDLTLRSRSQDTFPAKINFTAPHNSKTRIDSFRFVSVDTKELLSVTGLQKTSLGSRTRYFSTAPNAKVNNFLLQNSNFNLVLFSAGTPSQFRPTRKAQRHLKIAIASID